MKFKIIIMLLLVKQFGYSQIQDSTQNQAISTTLVDNLLINYSKKAIPSNIKQYLKKVSLNNTRFFDKKRKRNCFDCPSRTFKWYAFFENTHFIYYYHLGRGTHFHLLRLEEKANKVNLLQNIIILQDLKNINELKDYLSKNRILDANKRDL